MSIKKVQGKFYPLQHQEFLKLNQILTQSELAVYLWLKTNDPFGGKLIEADTQKIAEDLAISRRSVQRALVKLQQEGLVELVISQFKYRLKSKSTPESENNFGVKDNLQVATSRSPDDIQIASTPLKPIFETKQKKKHFFLSRLSSLFFVFAFIRLLWLLPFPPFHIPTSSCAPPPPFPFLPPRVLFLSIFLCNR